MQILVIEDNESNAYLARFLLERRGHRVDVTSTGTEGVVLARSTDYDLVLLDLRLPDGDGCDFVPFLMSSDRANPPAVIAVSAHALDAERARAIAVGCCAFMPKPIDVTTFADRIEEIGAARPGRTASANEPAAGVRTADSV
jgi:two-component system cell cycle response regulator DivK